MAIEEKKTDDVEKVLSDIKAIEDRKQVVIDELLRQREEFNAAIDEKLAKLGYRANSVKPRRSHHKKSADAPGGDATPKTKAKG